MGIGGWGIESRGWGLGFLKVFRQLMNKACKQFT